MILNAVCFPDVLVFIYESTWCHFPEDCIFVSLFLYCNYLLANGRSQGGYGILL